MSILNAIKDWHSSHPKIKNIVLFVSDALRWDYLPEEVRSMGVTFKAVASGSFTPTSFASIISGLYPSRHDVYNFLNDDWLSNVRSTLMNLDGYNSSFWTEDIWVGFDPPTLAPIYNVGGCKERVSLDDLKPPFIYLEDEKGGHCPYGWSRTNNEYEEGDCTKFFSDFGRKDVAELRKKYRTGAQRSLNEFQNRLKILENRGLLDETLVIFLSDHGELLGEYGGIVGHEHFTAPEVVYVPIVLIHPDLPKGETCENEGVLRHIDVYPTICSIIGRKVPTVDGVSLINMKNLPETGFTYYVENGKLRKHKFRLQEISLWDKDGGYVFRTGLSRYQRLLRSLYLSIAYSNSLTALYQRQRLRHRPWLIKDYVAALNNYYKSNIKYGHPSLKQNEARFLVEKASVDYERFRERQRIKRSIKRINIKS